MTVQPQAAVFELPNTWRELYELGFSVIPVPRNRKRPVLPWKAYQTHRAEPGTVRQWASQSSNIAIVTGRVSGLIVLDLDNPDAIAEAERRGMPDTLAVSTPRGRHVYFQHPGGELKNRAGILPGWDLRGDGGFVIAPGSYFIPEPEEIADGKVEGAYEWANPPGPFGLAPMPDWLLQLLDPSIEREAGKVRRAAKGTRNDELNRAAFKLGQEAEHGRIDPEVARERLRQAANDAGLGHEEAEATINSGLGAGRRNPKRKEPSEDDVALAFTAVHRDALRFDHNAGLWFEWDGVRWRKDGKHRAFTYARTIARQMDAGGKANFAGGVERFARADPAHAVTADVWDVDPMLLGTPAGTINLRTGKLSQPRPDDHITKQTGVAPEHGEPTLWLTFLEQATAGDRGLMRFLQQMAGYCLTGLTNEHALFFIYGPGGNGKSVFLNVLNFILGDYATTAGMDTFTASKSDRHPTDLAMLNGARLVSASETEEGRAWAEARIKQLTGGDKISARFMRQDFFEFVPQFKLVIVGNHAPVLANVDEAARRRFNIVPFTQKPERPDRQLEEKLRQEAGRILAWAIAGCKDWQENGLVRPEIVAAATADYFEDQDLFGQWIEERCERAPGKWEMPTPLYNDWAEYARAAGDDPGSQRAMSSKLKRAGFQPRKMTGGLRTYQGIALKPKGGLHE